MMHLSHLKRAVEEYTLSEEMRFDVSNNQTKNVGKILIVLLAAVAFIIYFTAKKSNGQSLCLTESFKKILIR